jgi:hypothetical protein
MEGMKQTTRPLYNNWGTLYAQLFAKKLQGTSLEVGSSLIYDKIEMINKQMKPWQRQVIESQLYSNLQNTE